MKGLLRRIASVACLITLAQAGALQCAGWQPTAAARMTCCSAGDSCPMHKTDGHGSHARHRISQQEADTCCARAATGSATPSPPPFSPAPSFVFLATPFAAAISSTAARPADSWRTHLTAPGTPIPKHLLLSVLLV